MAPISPLNFSARSFRPTTPLKLHRIDAANRKAFNVTLEKLSTGKRINRGADDPSGLITSENLRAVLTVLDAESRSAKRTQQVAEVADSALGEIGSLLGEAETLAVANANTAGVSDAERAANQMEMDSILSTVNRLAGSASFNGDPLLNGEATLSAFGESFTIDAVSVGAVNITSGDLEAAQQRLSDTRKQISTMRGGLGAFSTNTVGANLRSINTTKESIATALSQIRDTDFAKETAKLAGLTVLMKASQMAQQIDLQA